MAPNRSGVPSNFASFSATQTDLSLKDPEPYTFFTVNYDQVTLNDLKSLEGSSGIFTAPVKGIYHFSFSTTKRKELPNANVQIFKNLDQYYAPSISDGVSIFTGSGFVAPVMTKATLALLPGDKVWIKRERTDPYSDLPATSAENAALEASTYFTGFLIQPNVILNFLIKP